MNQLKGICPTKEEIIKEAQRALREEHQCHTVILYGSYAEGNITSTSDIDMMGVSDKIEKIKRDARIWKGIYLDLFIYPNERVMNPDVTMLYMRSGKVVYERDQIGRKFISNLNNIFEKGPDQLPDDEIHAREVWYPKMLNRAKIGDVEGDFRRCWLLISLLEDYFQLRGQWYEGPKHSFNWLKKHDSKVFRLFEKCLKDSTSFSQIENLIDLVVWNRRKS